MVLTCAVCGTQSRETVHCTAAVVVHCDNQGAGAVINSGYSNIPQIMHPYHDILHLGVLPSP